MPQNLRKSNLRTVLEAFRPEDANFGEAAADESPGPDGIVTFRRDLKAVSETNKSYFLVCVAFLVVLFAGSCYVIIHFIDKPKDAAAVFGVTGISFTGLIAQMSSLWKKKVTSDMLLVLAGQLQPSDLKGIVDVLLREYFK
jgi:hypothetical protein